MSELQIPPELQTNGVISTTIPPVTIPVDTTVVAAAAAPPKRQRRPSVRLGDIGDQHTFDNHHRRTKQNHQWKYPSSKSSKTRNLVNLTGVAAADYHHDTGDDKELPIENHHRNNMNNNINLDTVAIGSWKPRDSSKSKRGFSGTKRVRSNWSSKFDEHNEKFDEEEDDYEGEDCSGSQLKEQSLNFSMDNDNERDLDFNHGIRVRVSDSDTDRNWNNNNNNHPERNGVRVWLNQLGLGRYAPVFEIHEVDDEVLPLLTLEDLKDMGINAVGSRRKMFCSIQKLGKGFS